VTLSNINIDITQAELLEKVVTILHTPVCAALTKLGVRLELEPSDLHYQLKTRKHGNLIVEGLQLNPDDKPLSAPAFDLHKDFSALVRDDPKAGGKQVTVNPIGLYLVVPLSVWESFMAEGTEFEDIWNLNSNTQLTGTSRFAVCLDLTSSQDLC
jgi:hypothetical protein